MKVKTTCHYCKKEKLVTKGSLKERNFHHLCYFKWLKEQHFPKRTYVKPNRFTGFDHEGYQGYLQECRESERRNAN